MVERKYLKNLTKGKKLAKYNEKYTELSSEFAALGFMYYDLKLYNFEDCSLSDHFTEFKTSSELEERLCGYELVTTSVCTWGVTNTYWDQWGYGTIQYGYTCTSNTEWKFICKTDDTGGVTGGTYTPPPTGSTGGTSGGGNFSTSESLINSGSVYDLTNYLASFGLDYYVANNIASKLINYGSINPLQIFPQISYSSTNDAKVTHIIKVLNTINLLRKSISPNRLTNIDKLNIHYFFKNAQYGYFKGKYDGVEIGVEFLSVLNSLDFLPQPYEYYTGTGFVHIYFQNYANRYNSGAEYGLSSMFMVFPDNSAGRRIVSKVSGN